MVIKKIIPKFAFFAMLSVAAFAFRSISMKSSGFSIDIIKLLTVQGCISLPVLFFMSKESLMPGRGMKMLYAGRIIWGIGATAALYFSLQIMPATLASTLSYTAPLFLAVLGPWMLGEKSKASVILLTVMGFSAVLWGAIPSIGDGVRVWQIAAGFASGFIGAMSQVYIRSLSKKGEPSIRTIFWMHAVTVLMGIPLLILKDGLYLSKAELILSVIVAGLSLAGQIYNAKAYQYGNALPVNALSLAILPVTALLSTLFLGEQVSIQMWQSICIILPVCFLLIQCEAGALKHIYAKVKNCFI